VWPQSGRVACNLLTRRVCIPAAIVTDSTSSSRSSPCAFSAATIFYLPLYVVL
jgi:hypothetical protein